MILNTQQINKIFEQNNITYVAVFGSHAQGTERKESDIDLLFDYDSNQKFTLFDMTEIQLQLQKALGKKVDFVPLRGLHSEIKEDVLKSAVTIYEKR